MRKFLKVHFQRILSLFVLCVLCVAMFLGGQMTAPIAYADTGGELNYDQTNVLDDLTNATIGGKPFDLSEYPYNERGKPQIIAFTEYAYSFYSDSRENYGLYVYVYNPQGLAFDTDTDRNKIEFAYAEKENWDKYPLQFLNYSKRAGYEGLFYKFKVVLTAEQRDDILSSVEQNARVYEIVGIELSTESVVHDYTVAMRYTYSGYALGYGSSLATESSLACDTDGFEKYLNLDVHTTYYRPEGTNGENNYTQDSLHSVYFAVPKDVVTEYGALSAVHATWLDAVLAPVLVTGNKAAHDAIEKYLGQDIGETVDGLDYAYVGNANYVVTEMAGLEDIWGWTGPYGYNLPSAWSGIGGGSINEIDRTVSPLYWLVYSGIAENSADDYVLSSEEIINKLNEYTAKYGGELVNSRYSRVLFDSVASEFTDVNIPAEYEHDLRNEVLSSSWWNRLWGITDDQSDKFDGMKAIYPVSDNDFIYAGEEIDIADTCDNLRISEHDFTEFKDFYDKNKDDSIVYLFRYQVSDYISSEATLFEPDSMVSGHWNKTGDSNAYFMQQTVNLDFDIIDITFTKGNVSTVIPVVADPVDNIPDGTPPVYTEDDKPDMDWLKWLFGALALIIVLVIFAPIIFPVLGFIIKAVVWVIMLPFKLIAAIIKGIQKAARKKPKTTASSPTKAVKAPQPKTVYVKSDKLKQSKEKQNK